ALDENWGARQPLRYVHPRLAISAGRTRRPLTTPQPQASPPTIYSSMFGVNSCTRWSVLQAGSLKRTQTTGSLAAICCPSKLQAPAIAEIFETKCNALA